MIADRVRRDLDAFLDVHLDANAVALRRDLGDPADLDAEDAHRRLLEQTDRAREVRGERYGVLAARAGTTVALTRRRPRSRRWPRRARRRAAVIARRPHDDRTSMIACEVGGVGPASTAVAAAPAARAVPTGRIGGIGRSRIVWSQTSPQWPCRNALPKLFALGPRASTRLLERHDVLAARLSSVRCRSSSAGSRSPRVVLEQVGQLGREIVRTVARSVASESRREDKRAQQLGRRVEDAAERLGTGAEDLEDFAAVPDEVLELRLASLRPFDAFDSPSSARPRLPSGSSKSVGELAQRVVQRLRRRSRRPSRRLRFVTS